MTIGVDGNEANVQNRVGSGTYAFELLKQFYLLSLRGSGDSRRRSDLSFIRRKTLFIIYLKEKPFLDLPKETENFKYVVFGPKKFWTQFALPLKLKFGPKIDVLFSPAHYGPRFSRAPYVITIHDLSYLHYPEMFKKDDLYQLTSWSKYSIENSAHIITPSKTTKYDIVKNYGVDEAKITVTYEGYDQKRFKPQPKLAIDRIKGKFKIKGNYLIFVGTLQPRKNLERLIEAFSKIIQSSQLSTLKLVIAGKKGWLYESIFAKVKELNFEDKVIFTDYVPDDDLPALIGGASVYVLPSLWEGFGIPVVEAQACGVPVVVSNTSSLPEIVTSSSVIPAEAGIHKKILDQVENDGQASAILIDPQNIDSIAGGIKKALEPKTRIIFVKRGFENIKRFSWENCALETQKVLEGVGQNK